MFDIAAVITSKTRLSLLELFVKNEALELGIREAARRIKSNPMLVRSELMRLESSGILKSRKVANSIQFSLNPDCEGVPPFREIFGVNRI